MFFPSGLSSFFSAGAWQSRALRFVAAQNTSLFGSALVQYALIWHITLTTSSGSMLMLATMCGFLPQIFVSLFAGVYVDRYSRKAMAMLADAMVAFATAILAVALFMGNDSMVLLLFVLAVRALGAGIQMPAVNAMLPQIVPQAHLMRVNGINSAFMSCTSLLAPALSGALVSFYPLASVLMVDIVTALLGISITATIPVPAVKNDIKHEPVLQALRTCFLYAKTHSFLWRLLVFQFLVLFLISPSAFLTPLMVSRSFGPEIWRLTASEMAYSLGMVCGGLLIGWWGGFARRQYTVMLAAMVYGLLMLAIGLSPVFVLYLFFNALIGITAPCYNAPVTVLLQEKVESALHGRVFSILQITTSSALPLGMVVFGPLADIVTVETLLIGSGSCVVLLVVCAWFGQYFKE